MTTQWETVRIFISSTFDDMHAERDYLIKHVFPELREWCERRKLRLVDVDLRWGVREEDTRNRNVVEVCLRHIDEARPFFLCFLGQRRGWVPREGDISPSTLADNAYPDLKGTLGKASVTEIEILHAVVNPFHESRARKEQPSGYYEPAKYAHFYLRNPSYLEELPADFPQLRKIYTNEGINDEKEFAESEQELEKWVREKIPALCANYGKPKRDYVTKWNPSSASPELLLPLSCPSLMPDGVSQWQRKWADAGIKLTGTNVDIPNLAKAEEYNLRRSRGRLTGFECEGKPLSQIMIEDLQQSITACYPDHTDIGEATDLQKEIDQQEQFLFSDIEGFIERGDDFDELNAYVNGESRQLFVLTAPAGMGKSTLLANWIDHYRGGNNQSIYFRFIGQSDRSTTVYSLLYYLLREMKEVGGRFSEEIPDDRQKLRREFPKLLKQAGAKGRTVIVLDALNQLESGLSDLSWLPFQLPENIKLIVSFKRGEPESESLFGRMTGQVILSEVKPFENLEHRQELVKKYLDQFLKQLDQQLLNAVINLPGASNPLYLRVVLSELRVFGAFSNLAEKIRSDFGENPISTFNAVLNRLEKDPAYSSIDPRQAVPLLFGLLAHARHGLSVEELCGVFVKVFGTNKAVAADSIHLYLRQVQAFLSHRDGRYDFFFESFRNAAADRYVSRETRLPQRTAQDWHRLLADYFAGLPVWLDRSPGSALPMPNRRKVEELPYQYTAAQNWIRLTGVLRDLRFIEAKIAAGLMDDLLEDYRRAQIAAKHPLIRPLTEVRSFLISQAHILRPHPDLLYQQAANQPTGSLVAVLAQEDPRSVYWLRWLNKPERRRSCILEFSTGKETRAISAVDRMFQRVAIVQDATVTLIDLETGLEISTFSIERDARACCFSHDGTSLLLGYASGFIVRLDARTGQLLLRDSRHGAAVTGIDVSALVECSVAADGSVAIVHPDGNLICSFSSSFDHAYSCALHPLESHVIIGGPEAQLEYWDYQSRQCLAGMKGSLEYVELDEEVWSKHRSPIVDCQFSQDGKLAVAVQDGQCSGVVYVLEIRDGQFTCPYSFHGVTHKLGFLNRIIYLEGGFTACTVGAGTDGFFAVDSMLHLVSFKPARTGYTPRFIPGTVSSRCILCRQALDGKRILTVDDQGNGRLWDSSHLGVEGLSEPRALIPLHHGAVSPVRSEIVVCRDDGSLILWDAVRKKYGDPFGGDTWYDHARTCVSWSPDGNQVLAGGEEDYCFDLWTREGHPLTHFETSSAFPVQAEMAPDDSVGAFVTRDGTVSIRRIDQEGIERVLHRPDHSIEMCKFIHPSLLIVSWDDGVVMAWDWQGDRILWQKQSHQRGATCDCDPNTGRVVTAGRDGLLLIYDAFHGTDLQKMTIGSPIQMVAWSPDSRWLAVCAEDLLVMDVETWNVQCRWCFDKPLVFLGFFREPNMLAGGSPDGDITLLRIEPPRRA